VKNQYCWDDRDYFKYDVLDSLRSELSPHQRLTCLWMLTPDDGGSHGQEPYRPDPGLTRLTALFQSRLATGRKDVRDLREYFAEPYCSIGDQGPPYFSNAVRSQYFGAIAQRCLNQAIVFFDPDTGMEPPSGKMSSSHLGFRDLADVFARLGEESMAVVFQFYRREEGFWDWMANEIQARLLSPVAYVVSHPVALYVVPKADGSLPAIGKALGKVSRRGKNRFYRVIPANRCTTDPDCFA
jgi:hypothetical protein